MSSQVTQFKATMASDSGGASVTGMAYNKTPGASRSPMSWVWIQNLIRVIRHRNSHVHRLLLLRCVSFRVFRAPRRECSIPKNQFFLGVGLGVNLTGEGSKWQRNGLECDLGRRLNEILSEMDTLLNFFLLLATRGLWKDLGPFFLLFDLPHTTCLKGPGRRLIAISRLVGPRSTRFDQATWKHWTSGS
jgi:hypothetical protein